jgi:zinc protease
MKPIQLLAFFTTFLVLSQQNQKSKEFKVNLKIHLENGLQVILHIDRSDPVVAVALTSHVGSPEKKKAVLVAHLFGYLLLESGKFRERRGLIK